MIKGAFCPNFANKQVKQDFDELTQVLGENLAYYVWNKNNGNSLDKTPDGQKSQLFGDLLQYFKGDRIRAIEAKYLTYTNKFITRFGDWLGNKQEEPNMSFDQIKNVVSDDFKEDTLDDDLSYLTNGLQQTKYLGVTGDIQKYIEQFPDVSNRVVQNTIIESKQQFIQAKKDAFKQEGKQFTIGDYNEALKQFNEIKVNQIVGEFQKTLAKHFGLEQIIDNNGIPHFTSKDKQLEVIFVQNIDAQNNAVKGVYDSSGRLNAAANLIYISLLDGDATTFSHELAHHYVRMFWSTDLVQSALQSLDDKDRKEGWQDRLEEKLIDSITENVQDSDKTIKRSFWSKLKQLMKKLFNNITKPTRTHLLNAVTAAFMVNDDITNTKTITRLHDRYKQGSDVMYQTKEDESLSKRLISRYKTRLREYEHKSVKNSNVIAQLKNQIEYAKESDTEENIRQFIGITGREVSKVVNFLESGKLNDFTGVDAEQILAIKRDCLGFYKQMIEDILVHLRSHNTDIVDRTQIEQQAEEEGLFLSDKLKTVPLIRAAMTLQNDISQLEILYQQALAEVTKRIIDDYADKYVKLGDRETWKLVAEDWLLRQSINGDIGGFEAFAGMFSKSSNPVVKVCHSMMCDDEFEVNRSTLDKGRLLVKLYNRCKGLIDEISPVNFFKQFMELDKDGKPTGYFIRNKNYGQFYKDKTAFEQSLRDKYTYTDTDGNVKSLDVDDKGQTVFPEGYDDLQKSYLDDLDDWLDEHANRRYTSDYYKEKRRFLSNTTRNEYDRYQKSINIILDKYEDVSDISDVDQMQLDGLYEAKRQLSNHYTQYGVLKTGQDKQIADELTAWHKYLRDKVKYKPMMQKFNKDRQSLINKYGEDSRQVETFDKYNSSYRISTKFYEFLNTLLNKSDDMSIARVKRSDLMNLAKKQGFYNPDLSRFEGNEDYWSNCKETDEELSAEKKDKKSENSAELMKYIQFLDVMHDRNTTYYQYLKNKALDIASDKTGHPEFEGMGREQIMEQLFYSKYHYINNKGVSVPLTIFSYMAPSSAKITTPDGEIFDTVEKIPSGAYSELDQESEYANPEYDNEDRAYIQPKGRKYDSSERYNKINKDRRLSEFYNALLSIMDEANEMIPSIDATNTYKMPQILGNTISMIMRNGAAGVFNTLGYSIKQGFDITSKDEDIPEDDFATRPDGTRINNIPIRYVKMLDKPEFISPDLIGSIVQYYQMAKNYQAKTHTAPLIEAILEQLQNTNVLTKYQEDDLDGTSKNVSQRKNSQHSAQMVQNLLDIHYYGRQASSGDSNKRTSKTAKVVTKSVTKFKRFSSMMMLGLNLSSMAMGYLDSSTSQLTEAFAGKYSTKEDLWFATHEFIKSLPGLILSLGKPNVCSKLTALMQYNSLSKSNTETFHKLNHSSIFRFIEEHMLMGGYTLGDYTCNSMLLLQFYHHVKFYKGKFYTKNQLIQKFIEDGKTQKEAKRAYRLSRHTLYDAYEYKNGKLSIKPQFKDAIEANNNYVEKGVFKKLKDRSALYNGILSGLEKNKIQTNVWSSLTILMRTFLAMFLQERFGRSKDFITKENKNDPNKIKGGYNFVTGELQYGLFYQMSNALSKIGNNLFYLTKMVKDKKNVTNDEKYALRKYLIEFAIIGAFTAMFGLLKPAADDDKDKDPVKQFASLVTVRTFISRTTPIDPRTVLDLLSSASVTKSTIDDATNYFTLMYDLSPFSEYKSTDLIKSGAYKGKERWFRDIVKPTFLGNLYENATYQGNKSKQQYYYNQWSVYFKLFGIGVKPKKQPMGGQAGANPFGGNDFGGSFKSDNFKQGF